MLAVAFLFAQSLAPLDVTGVWATANGKAHVEITLTQEGIPRGEIIWYANFGKDQATSTEKAGRQSQRRELLGRTLLEGFKVGHDEDKWRKGAIYDPTSGKAYRSAIYRQSADILAVEGCFGFICRKQEWVRVPEDQIVRLTPEAEGTPGAEK